MNNLTSAAVEDKNYLIQKLSTQIDRLNIKKNRRTAKMELINKRLAEKKATIGTSEDSTQVVSTKYETKNNRDKDSFEKGLERKNARLTLMDFS